MDVVESHARSAGDPWPYQTDAAFPDRQQTYRVTMTTHAAQVLGKFAADLKFSDIPQDIVTRAKDCITDTVGAATFGSQFPWSRMATEYAQRYGNGGPCSVIGSANLRVHAPFAALANGVCS